MSRSLTYAELAEALRITPASANKLARRRRWPRLMGNDSARHYVNAALALGARGVRRVSLKNPSIFGRKIDVRNS